MNNPPYILTDVFDAICAKIKVTLNLANLNYQYGYRDELNETLKQWSENPEFAVKKYPLVWLVQPFTVKHDAPQYFGNTRVRIFLMQETSKEYKAKQRMTDVIKPILYPIYREILLELDTNPAIATEYTKRKHEFTDRYYWDDQQQYLNDVVDCMVIDNLEISIYNNSNC